MQTGGVVCGTLEAVSREKRQRTGICGCKAAIT
nr:MAG TPA: protein of unknown function (DUF2195) [Caudoviricetes sp.]